MIINFEISGLREKALIKAATASGVTPEEYAEGVVLDILNDRVRGYYLDKFNDLTTVEIINLFGDMT